MQHAATVEGAGEWQRVFGDRHPNFRMMGGTTADRRKLRRGAFLRGPALHDLCADEWRALLVRHDLSIVVDFRRGDEVLERPNRLPDELRQRIVSLPIDSGASARLAATLKAATISHDSAALAMRAAYTDFARLHLQHYANFLAHIARASGRGVFFHCTAGKDRTGFAAALILLALGIPREQVMADFLASGTLWSPDDALLARIPAPARQAIFGVEAAYLEAALDELDSAQGGAADFARRAMGGEKPFRTWVDQSLI